MRLLSNWHLRHPNVGEASPRLWLNPSQPTLTWLRPDTLLFSVHSGAGPGKQRAVERAIEPPWHYSGKWSSSARSVCFTRKRSKGILRPAVSALQGTLGETQHYSLLFKELYGVTVKGAVIMAWQHTNWANPCGTGPAKRPARESLSLHFSWERTGLLHAVFMTGSRVFRTKLDISLDMPQWHN